MKDMDLPLQALRTERKLRYYLLKIPFNTIEQRVGTSTRASIGSDYVGLEESNWCSDCLYNCKAMCYGNSADPKYNYQPLDSDHEV